jgi:MYXO-CTERM domain-containing protein
MVFKRSLALAVTAAMLSVPSIAVFAQDAAAPATPAATQNNNANDDGGFDLGWLGLIGLAGLLGLRKRDNHRR